MGQLRNPHPGEILASEFLRGKGPSQNALAAALKKEMEALAERFRLRDTDGESRYLVHLAAVKV